MKVLLMLICLAAGGIACQANAQATGAARDGTQIHYDTQGRRVGRTVVSEGRETHYDYLGWRTGHTTTAPDGKKTHYDYLGRRTGSTRPERAK